MNRNSTLFVLIFLSQILFLTKSSALSGEIGYHDPSTIVKEGNRYWVFSTGGGITVSYSNDLFHWTKSDKTVFANGIWPAWINTAVPGFNGDFWAPECIYMNGKYYLYYSCSVFGTPHSAIGLVTNKTLDPNSSDYKWNDEGLVVSSFLNDDFNAIDPAVFKDDNGDVYLTYGSFFKGIAMIKLNVLTGKPDATAKKIKVAGGGFGQIDWEAAYVFKNGEYYYLVVNRANCCRDISSTYFIVTGRSLNPTGPFLDDNNIDLKEGGGKHLLATSGKYIGPGHFGLLRDNGTDIISMHYYNGDNLGKAALDIASLKYIDGWPVITRDWLPSGRYKITNQHSGLVWDSWGCNGQTLEAIAQGQWHNLACQQWDIAPLGDGVYKIVSAREYGTVDAIFNPHGLHSKLYITKWLNTNNQKYRISRAADGSYIFTSVLSSKLIEMPSASTTVGVYLQLWDYTGHPCQKWYVDQVGATMRNSMLYVSK
jgi:arabinan endo-1,5-alpha-L-arabinosidase